MHIFLEQTAQSKRRKSTFKVLSTFRASKIEALGQGRGKEKNINYYVTAHHRMRYESREMQLFQLILNNKTLSCKNPFY